MANRGEATGLRATTDRSAFGVPTQARGHEPKVAVAFLKALVAQDRTALFEVLAPGVRMRGMAPGRSWESRTAEELIDDILLGDFFGPEVTIEELTWSRFGTIVDKNSASYYLRMRKGGQRLECEQHVFFDIEGGRIHVLHLACSGFTAVPEA